jgi:4-hydroxy-2-oxoheptanedioate aldolase
MAVGGSLAGQDAASRFGDRLRALEPLIGTLVTVPSVGLAELTAGRVDFVWIDLEHGALGVGDVQPLAIAATAARAAALVRLGDVADTGTALDAGVDGVVVPRVETPADAELLVERLRYPPRGSRGMAARRARDYGRDGALDAEPVCMVQIESPRGVDRAAEIAAVDGVDALVVGCADLSHSLGEEGRLGSPVMTDAVGHVHLAAASAGIPSGIAGPDDPAALAELGAGRASVFLQAADVRMYARALDAAVGTLRRELADVRA